MNGQTKSGIIFYPSGQKKGDVITVMIENRPELVATVIALAKIGVTAALVNTSQVGKVLAHSINLVKPIAVIVGEECRAAVDEIRHDLNLLCGSFLLVCRPRNPKRCRPCTTRF